MNALSSANSLPDIQNLNPEIPLAINDVGIKSLRIRLRVPEGVQAIQNTIATCSLGVRLSENQRGAHMSRFVEVVNSWDAILDKNSVRELLDNLCRRLGSPIARASFDFPFFIRKFSPSGFQSDMSYKCGLKAELNKDLLKLAVFLEVPVMTVCPCSMAICDEGAHSQRALVRMSLQVGAFSYFDKFIKLAETSASSAVYTLLKRTDEKRVTEQAFAKPAFVEDVARKAAFLLSQEKEVFSFEVEVESMESIHNHNAFAIIRG